VELIFGNGQGWDRIDRRNRMAFRQPLKSAALALQELVRLMGGQ
jgi:hypothetical protein